MKTTTLLLALLLAGNGLARSTTPVVYCADDAAGAQFALTVAQANGLDDDVRLVAGNYTLTQRLAYVTSEPHALIVSGGWNADCSTQNGGQTLLDAQGNDQVLRIYTDAVSAIGVSGITFFNGHLDLGGSGFASGLSVHSDGEVRIEQNEFFFNNSRDDAVAGGLKVGVEGSSGRLIVRNNLIVGNTAGYDGAAVLGADTGEQYVNGNTIIGNHATHASATLTGGLYLADGTSAHFTLSNNLSWANDGYDLYNANDVTTLIRNDIGVSGGMPQTRPATAISQPSRSSPAACSTSALLRVRR